ncbi:hypothetical protein FJV80_07895 [Mesorhizobium sp. WSM4310]|uniref:hypothetical protein n=1 Tax=Mesorhizobium sp. WSM4310 TaxID=2589883 RepID=UPI00115E319C|nr:hypothetical protein [Mesorhizobium sp. WSM4310]TRC89704.1 hypothetical protein FJV80_07895 [Mesorhizobium sp. WSM4310]
MPMQHPEYENENDEADNAVKYEERLVDQGADGEIYHVTRPYETPDEEKGTFILIPDRTKERHTFVGKQGDAHKMLGELNLRPG